MKYLNIVVLALTLSGNVAAQRDPTANSDGGSGVSGGTILGGAIGLGIGLGVGLVQKLRSCRANSNMDFTPHKPTQQASTMEELASIVVLCSTGAKLEDFGLSNGSAKLLKKEIEFLKKGDLKKAEKTFKKLLRKLKRHPRPIDIDQLIAYTMRESYLEQNKDLQYYASKVSFYEGKHEVVQKKLVELKTNLGHLRGQAKIDASQMISELESQLQTTGDDAQLANIDLQNMLQKLQGQLQVMINVMKMHHDIAMSIIRNIRA